MENMVVSTTANLLFLLQDLWEYINNDPVGRGISGVIFSVVFGLVIYFACTPFMLRKMEKMQPVRVREQDDGNNPVTLSQ